MAPNNDALQCCYAFFGIIFLARFNSVNTIPMFNELERIVLLNVVLAAPNNNNNNNKVALLTVNIINNNKRCLYRTICEQSYIVLARLNSVKIERIPTYKKNKSIWTTS